MNRYSRILELSTFSQEKLDILATKKITIIGCGGVGQHFATYLATNGIKNLKIVDFDVVEISNLNRQILLSEKDIGLKKTDVVKRELENRNSECQIESLSIKIDKTNISEVILGSDLVIDAVDNWQTKLIISEACKNANILFFHIGVDGVGGQFCLFKEKNLFDLVTNEILSEKRDGVLGPMVGVVSSLATLHLINYLVGEHNFVDILYCYKGTTNEIVKISL